MRLCWLSILAVSLSWGRGGTAETPRWLTDYDEARKLARRSGKPIFVVFRCEH